MPLEQRYSATDMKLVIENQLSAIKNQDGSKKTYLRGNGDSAAYGYENRHALVLFPVSDNSMTGDPHLDAQLRSIKTGLTDISAHVQAACDSNKKIIIPVVELQKTFGLFRRNHWVTLSYDPTLNIATLIDSRPWIISFLYPTKSMETMLREGLSTILGAEKISTMKFNKVYQGVQHNDTHCGAWTAANIMGLAGAGFQGARKPNNVEAQATAFTANDEVHVINNNIKIAGTNSPKLALPTGWLHKLCIRLGLTKYAPELTETLEMDDITSSSHTIITSTLPKTTPKQPNETVVEHAVDEWDIVDETAAALLERNTTTLDSASVSKHAEDVHLTKAC